MKRNILLTLLLLSAFCLTSCHKDCVCKYYRKGKLYDVKTWKDRHVTEEDCAGMNDSYTLSVPIGELDEVELVDYEVVCER